MPVKVKICGITNLKDAQAACRFGADMLGFIFAKSPRRISPKKAGSIIENLPSSVAAVGVFVNEKKKKVLEIAESCGLEFLQFHGDETPAYCEGFGKKYKIIKAVRVRNERSVAALGKYNVDALLLDAYLKGMCGGTGTKFNWIFGVKAKKYKKPIILAGGIGPENVKEAIRKVRPYAIDVSTAIERAPGQKDHKLMKTLLGNVRSLTKPKGKRL